MIRLALVQISYLPAYFSRDVDLLSIDGYTSPLDINLTKCLPAAVLSELRDRSRTSYEEITRDRIARIVRSAHGARANLIVFPEYAVPLSSLQVCRSLAKELKCTIVSGSHRVPAEREKEYAMLGFLEQPSPGTAISPIFGPDGTSQIVGKKARSKWETDLELTISKEKVSLKIDGNRSEISALLCIDALQASMVGDEFKEAIKPKLLVCPSCSPSVNPFEAVGSFLTSNDCLLGYANDAKYGRTSLYSTKEILSSWAQPLIPCKEVGPGVEAILRADLDLAQIPQTKGTVYGVSNSTAPWFIPIVHALDNREKLHSSLVKNCERSLGEGKPSKIVEGITNYLATHGGELDSQIYERLRLVKEIAHESNALSREKTLDALRVCFLPGISASPHQREANELLSLQKMLRDRILDPDSDAAEIGAAISAIKVRCTNLPPSTEKVSQSNAQQTESQSNLNRGIEWSIARFQNRGSELDKFRQLVQNEEIAAIFVSGPTGIGKTDFVRAAMSKLFPGHQGIQVSIYRGMSVSQMMTEVAVSLGLPFDVDALESMPTESLANPLRDLTSVFQMKIDQFLILDDLALLYRKGMVGRDPERLKQFLASFCVRSAKRRAKVIIGWSGFIPEHLRTLPYAATIDMKVLEPEYMRRIVERQAQLVKGRFEKDADLTVKDQVVTLLSGHPLSALTLVEYARERGDSSIFRSVATAQAALTAGLLATFISDQADGRYLKILSCIRRPISLSALSAFDEEGMKLAEFALSFAERAAILLPEGDGVKLHEAVREHFKNELDKDLGEKRRVHQYLAQFYKSIIPNRYIRGREALVARAEYVHHLVAGGTLEKTTQEARQLVTQIKRSAREVYSEARDYRTALDALEVAASIAPKDGDIQEMIGRCHARLNHWDDSDTAFTAALDIARQKRYDVGWILKNWGHIRARYDYYDRAEELFAEAEQERDGLKDPSIFGARAYMNWRRGQLKDAEKGFCAALERDPNHRYSLLYYSKFLRANGKTKEAGDMYKRLKQLKESDPVPYSSSKNEIEEEEEDE